MPEREFITRDEAEHLMEQAAERGARKALQDIGIDRSDWREQQADMRYLRDLRQGSDQIKRWGTRATVTAFVSGLAWVVWQGIRQIIRAHGS